MNCNKNNMFITLSVKLILIHAVSINIDTAIKKKDHSDSWKWWTLYELQMISVIHIKTALQM